MVASYTKRPFLACAFLAVVALAFAACAEEESESGGDTNTGADSGMSGDSDDHDHEEDGHSHADDDAHAHEDDATHMDDAMHMDDAAHGDGLPAATVAAVCGGTLPDESTAVAAADAGSAEEPTVVDAAAGPVWFTVPASGHALLAFNTDVSHGDWRVIAGEGVEIERIGQPAELSFTVEAVMDAACTDAWASSAVVHLHDPARWEVELHGTAGEAFLFAVVFEGAGH